MANKLSTRIVFQRLPIAIATFLLSALLAKILGAAEYGQIAFSIFFIKNLPSMNLGISYGFIFFYYNKKKSMKNSYLICFLLFSMLSLILGAILVNPLVFSLGICMAPFYIIDPILRIRSFFILSFIPEILLLISFCMAYMICPEDIWFISLILTPCLSVLVLFLFKGRLKFLFKYSQVPNLFKIFNDCIKMIKKGFQSYLQLALIFSFLFLDRYFASVYFSRKDLGNYMLAFQFVQGALFIVTSLNIPNLTTIGEQISNNSINKRVLKHTLKQNIYFGIVSLVMVYLGLLLIKPYLFGNFENLLCIYLVISPGLFAMTVIGSISPILFYFEKQGVASFSIMLSILCIFINYTITPFTHLNYISVILINYSFLMISSLFIIMYSLFVFDIKVSKGSYLIN